MREENTNEKKVGVVFFWTCGFPCRHSSCQLCADCRRGSHAQYEGLNPKQRQEKLIEGARKEGTVVIYSFTAVDQLTALLEEFQKRYPFVKAEHYRANASGVFNKFTTEVRAGRTLADVLDISAGESYTLRQMGLIDPYLAPSREGISKDFIDERGYWAAHYHFVVALGVNTKAIPASEAPRSYGELTNPKWKGRFSLDPADQDLFGALLLHWGKDKALEYFKNLAKLEPRMVTGHTQQANLVGSGEIQMAPWLYGYRPLQLKDEGAPVEVFLFDPVLTNPAYLLLAKNSPHPHAAALLIDWALSADGGMKFFGEKFGPNAYAVRTEGEIPPTAGRKISRCETRSRGSKLQGVHQALQRDFCHR